MPRYTRNTIITAALEPTYGTSASPAAADAILLSNPSIKPYTAKNVPRDLVRGYMGGSPQLVGPGYVEISGVVELAGSGTATTPPKWGRLMQAMGFAQTIGAASVDYTLTSTFGANSSLTINYFLEGQLHAALGCRGTATISMRVGERPELRVRFLGLYGGLTAASNPTPDYTAFRAPLALTDANTGDLLLGAVTYTASTGVIGAGTAYVSQGLDLDLGNNLVFQPLLGREEVLITGREVQGGYSLDLSAADAVTFMNDVRANTLGALGLTHGTAAGNTVGIYCPSTQRVDPAVSDLNGQAFHDYSVRVLPVSGNDELRIVVR